MTDGQFSYVHVGPELVVMLWTLDLPSGRRMADVYLRDDEAHAHFWERRYIEGRLYGRVGTRRYDAASERRVVQGEHALATQTLRQAGLEPRRVSGGRGWL